MSSIRSQSQSHSDSGRRVPPSAGSASLNNSETPAVETPAVETPAVFPHEKLDVHQVLVAAYQAIVSWPVSFSRGTTGDQLKRAAGSALLRYAEGFYAQGGFQSTHWVAARASCGEAGAAAMQLVLERRVPAADVEAVRRLLARAMSMLHRLSRRV